MPAEGASAVATVADTSWMAIGQIVYAAKSDGSVVGYLQATAIGGATTVTLKNIEDTATLAYVSNSAPGTIFTIGSKLCAGGLQGPAGTVAGTAVAGDLKGTLVNPLLSVGNTKGSSLWGNGTDTVAVPASTDGHMLAYDSTDNIIYADPGNSTAGDATIIITEVIDAGTTNGLVVGRFISTNTARFVSAAF